MTDRRQCFCIYEDTQGACPTIRFIDDAGGGYYYVISGGLDVRYLPLTLRHVRLMW